jgi:hypothetical protein
VENEMEISSKKLGYRIEKQRMIVVATMCLHNFIHENHAQDREFRKCNKNPDYMPTIPSRYRKHYISHDAGDTSHTETDDLGMDRFRDDIARAILLSRSS